MELPVSVPSAAAARLAATAAEEPPLEPAICQSVWKTFFGNLGFQVKIGAANPGSTAMAADKAPLRHANCSAGSCYKVQL